MNRLISLWSLLFVLATTTGYSQSGYLFVKKGIRKKKTYVEGDFIAVRLDDGSFRGGEITLLLNDTVYINGEKIPRISIREVVLKKKPKIPFPDPKTLALIGAGAGLTTAGLAISKQTTFKKALEAGLVIGFAPLLIRDLGARLIRLLSRKEYRIGRKFRLQMFDLHLTPQLPARPF